MFYISSKKDGLYGVTDTEDGVEDFYTLKELGEIVKTCKLDIKGLKIHQGKFSVNVYSNEDFLSRHSNISLDQLVEKEISRG